MTPRCDWDRQKHEPAKRDEGCRNDATLAVTNGLQTYRLCRDCAALRRFKEWKKAPL